MKSITYFLLPTRPRILQTRLESFSLVTIFILMAVTLPSVHQLKQSIICMNDFLPCLTAVAWVCSSSMSSNLLLLWSLYLSYAISSNKSMIWLVLTLKPKLNYMSDGTCVGNYSIDDCYDILIDIWVFGYETDLLYFCFILFYYTMCQIVYLLLLLYNQ
mgnify:CR=1 FL=1